VGVREAGDRWRAILAHADPDAPVAGLMPQPRPLSFVASWVTFELTKNLAEINQLRIRRENGHR